MANAKHNPFPNFKFKPIDLGRFFAEPSNVLPFLAIDCPAPQEPKNGFIYFPCDTRFGSQCLAGCNDGYYINETTITCSVSGTWEPGEITCNGKIWYCNLYFCSL